jgi:hypothetical protein
MSKIWRYVLVHDSGLAPCIDDGMLSLCCCKPLIRKNANVGDWVVGLKPKRYGVGLVAWAGQISALMPMGAYCEAHPNRTDSLYGIRAIAPDGSELLEHLGSPHHTSQREQATDASGVNALMFSPFWYFGSAPKALPENLMGLCHYYVGQTSKVSSTDEIERLKRWLGQWKPGVEGDFRGSACRPRKRTESSSPCSSRTAAREDIEQAVRDSWQMAGPLCGKVSSRCS